MRERSTNSHPAEAYGHGCKGSREPGTRSEGNTNHTSRTYHRANGHDGRRQATHARSHRRYTIP